MMDIYLLDFYKKKKLFNFLLKRLIYEDGKIVIIKL